MDGVEMQFRPNLYVHGNMAQHGQRQHVHIDGVRRLSVRPLRNLYALRTISPRLRAGGLTGINQPKLNKYSLIYCTRTNR
jgi:hypothetical protein